MAPAAIMSRALDEWRRFRDDTPGCRFRHYNERLHTHGTRTLRVFGILCGGVLVVAGIARCFLPGPGVITILLGLALFGGESRRLARRLDRLEPAMRRKAKAIARWWKRRSLLSRGAMIAIAMLLTGLAMRAWWAFFAPW